MRRFSPQGLPQHSAPFTIPAAPPTPIPDKKTVLIAPAPVSWPGELIRLGATIGSAGLHNHRRGRWFRITRFQAETVGACMLYVILCIGLMLVRAGVITIHWLRGG
jgi:hypothetical protein